MAGVIATEYVSIVPTVKGVGNTINNEISKSSGGSASAGKTFGQKFSTSFKSGVMGLAKVGAVVGSTMVAGGKKALGTFMDYAGTIRGLQRIVGGTIEEVSGMREAMVLSGIDADKAGTSMTIFSKKISSAAGGNKSAAKSFADLGINIKNSDGSLKSTNQLMTEASDKFKGMENGAQKTALATQLFGKSGTAMLPFLDQGSAGIAELTKRAEEMGLVLSQEDFDKFAALKGQMRTVAESIKGVFVKLGAAIAPLLTPIFEFLANTVMPKITQAVSKTMPFFEMLGTKVKKIFDALGGVKLPDFSMIVAPLGGVIGLFGGFASKIPIVGKLFTGLTGPIGIIAGIIGYLLIKSEAFRNMFIQIGTTIMALFARIVPPLQAAITQIMAAIMPLITQLVNTLAPVITDIITVVADLVGDLVEFLLPVITKIVQALKPIISILIKIVGGILKTIVIPIIKTVVKIIKSVITTITEVKEGIVKFFSKVSKIWTEGWEGIKSVVLGIVDWFKDFPDKVWKAIKGIKDIGKKFVKGLWNGITSLISWVLEKISGFGGMIIGAVKKLFGIKSPSKVFAEIGKNLMIGFNEGLNKIPADLSNFNIVPDVNKLTSGIDVVGAGGITMPSELKITDSDGLVLRVRPVVKTEIMRNNVARGLV